MEGQKLPETYSDYISIIHAFQVSVAQNKSRPFVHYQQSNLRGYKTLTYEQLDKITTYLANEWAPVLLPIIDSDTQCIASLGHESSIQSLLLLLTIWKLGLSYFPISIWCDETAVSHLLKREHVGCVIASESYIKESHKSVTRITMENTSFPIKKWIEYDIDHLVEITAASNDSIPEAVIPAGPDNIAVILVTGGSSSGIPKAIRYSNWAFLYTLIDISLKHEDQLNGGPMFMKPTDVWLLALPVERMSTIYMFLWGMLLGGSVVIFQHDPPLSMNDIFAAGEIYKPTWTYLPPNILEQVAEYLQNHSPDDPTHVTRVIQGIKTWMTGGAPLRLSTAEFLSSQGLNLASGYGASEFGALCTSLKDNKPGKSIFQFSKTSLCYLDFEPFDQNICHLVVRSDYPGLATDVGNRPNGDFETKDLFTKSITSNDNTNLNEAGDEEWAFVGRINDTFIMENGKRIYPTPMEWEICTEDIIQNCIIVGENKRCAAVLIGLAYNKAINYSPTMMITKVHEAVKRANKRVPHHSSVTVPTMVHILPLNKKLPITDKGTVFRKGVYSDFHLEIEELYDNYNSDTANDAAKAEIIAEDLSVKTA
ncbi:hypothetical protein BDA99DRAFT_102390 [Phascolomyces articulosus]|uniref:AMP-dependent synthetase/ligase domain-containing protein n=1 Tax=Phascolomyces articulosus TaxID=60185 RepID=A0AAD5PC93_9FUNG|nr:hypothetical protein BDA99DRAFT_102390 [Phascolomyces articulosus]